MTLNYLKRLLIDILSREFLKVIQYFINPVFLQLIENPVLLHIQAMPHLVAFMVRIQKVVERIQNTEDDLGVLDVQSLDDDIDEVLLYEGKNLWDA